MELKHGSIDIFSYLVGRNSSGGGGESPEVGVQLNPFSNGVSFYTSNGVDIESQHVDADGTATFSCKEYSSYFEYFCLSLGALDRAGTYLLEFDYQTTSGEFMSNGMWNIGFDVLKTAITQQPRNADAALVYPNNIVRDYLKRHYKLYFRARDASYSDTPPSGTQNMYANFAVWGYSDDTINYFTISNMKLWKVI